MQVDWRPADRKGVGLVVAHHVSVGVVGAFFFEVMVGGTKGQKQGRIVIRPIFGCGNLVDDVVNTVLGGAVHLESPKAE